MSAQLRLVLELNQTGTPSWYLKIIWCGEKSPHIWPQKYSAVNVEHIGGETVCFFSLYTKAWSTHGSNRSKIEQKKANKATAINAPITYCHSAFFYWPKQATETVYSVPHPSLSAHVGDCSCSVFSPGWPDHFLPSILLFLFISVQFNSDQRNCIEPLLCTPAHSAGSTGNTTHKNKLRSFPLICLDGSW